MASAAGIIGGLLSYIVINGANLLLDKLAECMHWSIAGTDAQPSGAGGSFISRLQSNTGGAAQARTQPTKPACPSTPLDSSRLCPHSNLPLSQPASPRDR